MLNSCICVHVVYHIMCIYNIHISICVCMYIYIYTYVEVLYMSNYIKHQLPMHSLLNANLSAACDAKSASQFVIMETWAAGQHHYALIVEIICVLYIYDIYIYIYIYEIYMIYIYIYMYDIYIYI